VSETAGSLADLPTGAKVGTSSLRRRAMVKRLRPDLEVVEFRGNVQTRLSKLRDGVADATLLACAGLRRLGLGHLADKPIAVDDFLPAVGQGAICIESRVGDTEVDRIVAHLHDATTGTALVAERAFLAELDGSCRTPIAGLARIEGGTIRFDGLILKPDGSEAHAVSRAGASGDAAAIGQEAGAVLKRAGGPDFFVIGH
jgi:hydroxymethylbilane synthase